MGKIRREPFPLIYPLPVSLVTCSEASGGSNITTVAWVTNVCAAPPMVAISLRPHRYSTSIIEESGEFAVNMPSRNLAYEVDLCGTLSGREADKARISGLTEVPGDVIRAPLLAECVVNMECRTRHVLPLGSHVLFIGEIVALHIEEDLLSRVEDSDLEDDERYLDVTRARPMLYSPQTHDYWTLGEPAQPLSASAGKKP